MVNEEAQPNVEGAQDSSSVAPEATEPTTEQGAAVEQQVTATQVAPTEEEPVAEAAPAEAEPKEEQATEQAAPVELPDNVVECGDPTMDWNLLEKEDLYTEPERDHYKLLYEQTLSTMGDNEVIEGKVIAITKREVEVDVGYKSTAVVSVNEFRYNPDLQIGDTVELYVESQEDKRGQLLLSHKKARVLKAWDRINDAFEKDEIITGFIKCRTKGGMIVDVFGIEAFLPGSQIDVRPIRDYDMYVEKTMEFKVVKINQEYKNVVVSHKALIEAELEAQRKGIISKLEKGQVLEGIVKNITNYGVFVDLGGVDGLVHITDLSWCRVNHPSEVVSLDEKINVAILDFDKDKKRIALGIKQLTPHPWDALDDTLKVGDRVNGSVAVVTDYGAFVEVAPGIEGLLHVSEMSWSQHLRSAHDVLKAGDKVEVQILNIDREGRKMSLGMKQLHPDPWSDIEQKYPVGSRHTSKVRNFTGFGIFVEMEEGIDGLVHISDLSWTKRIKHPSEFIKVGEPLEVVVLSLDKNNRRMSLGHKQLEENPWDVFESIFSPGSVHEGTLTDVFEKGAMVALPYGVEGFCTPRNLVKEDGTKAEAEEKLPFKVVEFNKVNHRIIVSHTRTFEDVRRDNERKVKDERRKNATQTQNTMRQINAAQERTTLGDISELAQLKEDMVKAREDDTQDAKE